MLSACMDQPPPVKTPIILYDVNGCAFILSRPQEQIDGPYLYEVESIPIQDKNPQLCTNTVNAQ
jgi:hypothetical protein